MSSYLTPEQFQHTAAARKPGATYTSYKTYVANTRAKRAAARKPAVVNPYSAPAPAGISPSVQAEAQGMVQPIFAASLKQITDSINSASRAGSNAIAGYGKAYLASLPAVQHQVDSIYKQAGASQAGLDSALTSLIQGQGAASTAAQAAANFAGHGTGAGTAAVGALGAGATAANAAQGATIMGGLTQQGAAERAYTAQLPAWGQAGIGYQTGNFLAGQQKQLADATATIQAQVPQALQSAYDTIYNRQQAEAQQRFQQQQFAYQQQQDAANAAENHRQALVTEQQNQERINLDKQAQQAALDAKSGKLRTPADWNGALGKISTGILGTFAPLIADSVNPSTGQIRKGLSRKQMRARVRAAVLAQLGPNVPQRLLNPYVDNILIQLYGTPANPRLPGAKSTVGGAAGGGERER